MLINATFEVRIYVTFSLWVWFFSHLMLFTTFIENKLGNTKTFWLRKTIISHLMFSSCFLCWKY